jgi:hypothetical protein
MARPWNERQALEEERAELPALIAHYRHELTATPAGDKTRREMLDWQIRRDWQGLMATIDPLGDGGD